HLELKRYFGVDELLSESNAGEIYKHCNSILEQDNYATQGLLAQMKVEVVCSTDDPIDSLDQHILFNKKGKDLGMYPAFRPDKAYSVENPSAYKSYISNLGESAGVEITSFDKLLEALSKRIDYFHDRGCRLCDHGLEQ